MAENQKIEYDVEGGEVVSKVLLDILNTYPGLNSQTIKFSTLDEDSGIGFFPTSGAVLLKNKKTITGKVSQECQYPFTIVYRSASRTAKPDSAKLNVKELLDNIGKWLELQPVKIGSTEHKLSDYPELNCGNRQIKSIERTNAAHLDRVYDDKVEDWTISARLIFTNEYYK